MVCDLLSRSIACTWSKNWFKACTQKINKTIAIVYVLILFFLSLLTEICLELECICRRTPELNIQLTKVQQNSYCSCHYQPSAVMPPRHFAKKKLLQKINKLSIIWPSRRGLGSGRCRSGKKINANQTFRKVNIPCSCLKNNLSAA